MVAQPIDRDRTIEYARETLRGETPEAISWIHALSRPHLVQFAVELSEAVRVWAITGADDDIVEILDAWQATAELDSDSEYASDLRRPREEKEYVDWSPTN